MELICPADERVRTSSPRRGEGRGEGKFIRPHNYPMPQRYHARIAIDEVEPWDDCQEKSQ